MPLGLCHATPSISERLAPPLDFSAPVNPLSDMLANASQQACPMAETL